MSQPTDYPKPTTWEGSYTYNYCNTFGTGQGPKKYIVVSLSLVVPWH